MGPATSGDFKLHEALGLGFLHVLVKRRREDGLVA